MGRQVFLISAVSMNLVFYWSLLFVSVSPLSVTADLNIYPEFADEVVVKRIQHVLSEWRQKHLRIQISQHPETLPPFTYNFPDDSSNEFQSGFFAVPPSDPKYYQSELDVEKDDTPSILKKSENDQLGIPVTTDEKTFLDDTSGTNEPQMEKAEDISYVFKKILAKDDQDILLVAIIAGCGAATAAGLVALSIGWYKFHNNSKAAADIEYPAYGVTGPNKEITPTGDRRLAQSAQMYHYQHQKQQIIAMESSRANNERRGSVSEGDSDEENEEGDYTVYECPGLAATGELEVKNPLFHDDPTPAAGNQTIVEPPTPTGKNN